MIYIIHCINTGDFNGLSRCKDLTKWINGVFNSKDLSFLDHGIYKALYLMEVPISFFNKRGMKKYSLHKIREFLN